MEIICYGELDPGISQEDAAKWMQGKWILPCRKKHEPILGVITLAEPHGEHGMKVTVMVTNKRCCEEWKNLDYFTIRGCDL